MSAVNVSVLSVGAMFTAKFVLLNLSGLGAGALCRVGRHHWRRIVVLAVLVLAYDLFPEVVPIIRVEVDRLFSCSILGVEAEEDALELFLEQEVLFYRGERFLYLGN